MQPKLIYKVVANRSTTEKVTIRHKWLIFVLLIDFPTIIIENNVQAIINPHNIIEYCLKSIGIFLKNILFLPLN